MYIFILKKKLKLLVKLLRSNFMENCIGISPFSSPIFRYEVKTYYKNSVKYFLKSDTCSIDIFFNDIVVVDDFDDKYHGFDFGKITNIKLINDNDLEKLNLSKERILLKTSFSKYYILGNILFELNRKIFELYKNEVETMSPIKLKELRLRGDLKIMDVYYDKLFNSRPDYENITRYYYSIMKSRFNVRCRINLIEV